MSGKTSKKQEVKTVISLSEWMVSCGMFFDQLMMELDQGDVVYGVSWQEETVSRIWLTNRVGRTLFDKHSELMELMTVDMPDGIGAVEVPNPYYEPPTEKPADVQTGLTSDLGDEFPF